MNLNLSGKGAVVCGSTQGIGKAIAIELSKLGAAVTLVARDEKKLRQVKKQLSNRSLGHDYICADFNHPEELKKKISAWAKKNTAHILVNNSGGPHGGKISEAKTEEFTEAFSRHVICNQILVQALTPAMKKAKYGRIINIISTSVKQPIPDLGVSNTTRWAVAAWAKTLSMELGKFGITVNNILPGSTDTARLRALLEKRAKNSGRSLQDVIRDSMKEIPIGRFAKPEEIAYAAAFLASPSAEYITGINLTVDGGRTACL